MTLKVRNDNSDSVITLQINDFPDLKRHINNIIHTNRFWLPNRFDNISLLITSTLNKSIGRRIIRADYLQPIHNTNKRPLSSKDVSPIKKFQKNDNQTTHPDHLTIADANQNTPNPSNLDSNPNNTPNQELINVTNSITPLTSAIITHNVSVSTPTHSTSNSSSQIDLLPTQVIPLPQREEWITSRRRLKMKKTIQK
jgi:hypothetical protein